MKNNVEAPLEPYLKHLFICTNQKKEGRICCANKGSLEFFEYLKEKVKDLDAYGEKKIRVSQSGCLGHCQLGPCAVIYPENIWYTFTTFADLDQMLATLSLA